VNTPAELRAAAEAELEPLGKRRLRLLAQLAEVDRELRPVVVRAVDVEVSQRRIEEITGLARGTIRSWYLKKETT
jgi:hypothetical protein